MSKRKSESDKAKEVERSPSEERKEMIAKLIQRGSMRHEFAGQYFNESTSDEFRKQFPVYDVKALTEAFPRMLEIGFHEVLNDSAHDDERIMFYAVIREVDQVEKSGIRIRLGSTPPRTTVALISVIRDHLMAKSETMLKDLEVTKKLFEDFDE